MEVVESPCLNICRVNSEGICVGCRRTREEIGNWGRYTNVEKLAVIEKTRNRTNVVDDTYSGFSR